MMSPSLPLLARSAGTAPGLPQSAKRELRFPNACSRTKMYKDAGGILSPAKIPPDNLAAGGQGLQSSESSKRKPLRLSRAQTGGYLLTSKITLCLASLVRPTGVHGQRVS
ncbi:hypothetical protein NDU88_002129 [Pleurodeles waltl]|uniref:Uncharacterized protein n=1 Tax=Pleurodeles waltl TaxID=8319 RepID=A0AAV7LEU3_PLEWA|nr:hypothetical protein NDU88_002129 [Pleurodeles waltl]